VFYLGFPLACLLLRRPSVLAFALLGLAVSLPWTLAAIVDNDIWKEKAYLPGMAAIAMGVLGALASAHWRAPLWAVRLLRWGGAIGLFTVFIGMRWLWPLLQDGVMLLLTFSAVCVLIACAQQPSARPWKGLGWLHRWGALSYEIYLTHMFVVFSVVGCFHAFSGELRHAWLWYLPAMPLCWLLGSVVERWLSLPSERWLRGRWLAPRAQTTVAIT
jgi:peptidoglycan/LPS O-acetylase OafA/YrhL